MDNLIPDCDLSVVSDPQEPGPLPDKDRVAVGDGGDDVELHHHAGVEADPDTAGVQSSQVALTDTRSLPSLYWGPQANIRAV